ncbi:hypothetical protein [Vitiosangium sp. GDMCC 1.1324]|uniref:hypothetical protein n=1 Tax=Vitiosangium sp. (strain GDMCC 1.1324) TaxID=2138576 RepID=UPI0011B3C20D|nr:hypothetical protein [Vitiosangium sp. GDMCC 1.1324]
MTSSLVACGGDSDDPGGGGSGTATHFFLPTSKGDNTAAPALALDGKGGLHTVYPAYAGGGAYYAFCANGCQRAEDVSSVHFDTEGTVTNAMLALDAQGRPRVLLSAYAKVYYASCDSSCTDPKAWKVTAILDHAGKKEVSGPAFALDPQGRPRFLLHTYLTYLGIGQGAPLTEYVTCDQNCQDPSAWKVNRISDQIWHHSELRFDAEGHPRAGTIVRFVNSDNSTTHYGSYVECRGDCTQEADWNGTTLGVSYSSETEAVRMQPAIALALTSSGKPRVLLLARSADNQKQLAYLSCDEGCISNSGWSSLALDNSAKIDDGLDLALNAQGHPRIVYTYDYNIILASCDAEHCENTDAKWNLRVVEDATAMKSDEIFLYENCNVGTWFLHAPSLVLTQDGGARVGYQSRDVSGGWVKKDPNGPDCVAGTDMTWSRLAVLKP